MAGIGGKPASPKPLATPELLGRMEGRQEGDGGGGINGGEGGKRPLLGEGAVQRKETSLFPV